MEKFRRVSILFCMLVLTGCSTISLVDSEILAHTLPHAQLKRWRSGGHAMIYQYPDELANAIHVFVLGDPDAQKSLRMQASYRSALFLRKNPWREG
jgi:hypothetical protein